MRAPLATLKSAPEVELIGAAVPGTEQKPWLAPIEESELSTAPKNENPAPVEPQPIFGNHLRKIGMTMRTPEKMAFGETKSRGAEVLVGTDISGMPKLYLFSMKRKLKPEQAKSMIEDQFQEDGLRVRKISSMNSRGGVGVMTVLKGLTRGNEEFQAYSFSAGKKGYSHMLILVDSELSRKPARVRQLIDSISASR